MGIGMSALSVMVQWNLVSTVCQDVGLRRKTLSCGKFAAHWQFHLQLEAIGDWHYCVLSLIADTYPPTSAEAHRVDREHHQIFR